MLATCICLNGSLLDQLSCTIVYLHNLFTCTFGRINMSVCLSVCLVNWAHGKIGPVNSAHVSAYFNKWTEIWSWEDRGIIDYACLLTQHELENCCE